MAFDLQSLMAALGMGGSVAPQAAMPLGGNLPMGPAAPQAVMPPQPPSAPGPSAPVSGGLAGLLGMSPGAMGGFGSPGGIGGSGLGGPMSLLNAGANMLTASGPGNAGLGSILGSGIGGLMAGGQMDRAQAMQQQQQASLRKIAEQLMKQPSGAQPTASAVSPAAPPPQGVMPPPPQTLGASPQVPGAPPVPGPTGGGQPLGSQQQGMNPFIQMMLARRMGRMA